MKKEIEARSGHDLPVSFLEIEGMGVTAVGLMYVGVVWYYSDFLLGAVITFALGSTFIVLKVLKFLKFKNL